MKVEIPNADLGAIKDAIMTLEGGQRHGKVFATGIDGKQQFQQRTVNGMVDNVAVVLVEYAGDHKKFVFKDEGAVRYKLGRALKTVETQIRDVDKKRNEMLEQAWETQRGDDKLKDSGNLSGAHFLSFQKELNALMAAKTEMEINPVLLSQIDIDKNVVQANVLSALIDTVIKDDSKDLYDEKESK